MVLLCGCGSSQSSVSNTEPSAAASASASASGAVKPSVAESSDTPETKGSEATSTTGGKENALLAENFSTENGYIIYNENGQRASATGIDISSYSGEVDWNRVKNAGIEFVMVRLGGRGYGAEGSLYSDNNSQAVTDDEAREEAEYCQQLLGGLKLDFPLAYDWEIIKEDEARTDNLSVEQATSCALAFCAKAKELGFTPLLYASDAEFSAKYDMNRLSDCDIWYCEYADTPHFPYRFSMWQYSKTANVDGIEGNVDLDICFKNIAEY